MAGPDHAGVLSRFLVLGAADAAAKAIAFVATLAVGRALGPAAFGEISLAQAAAAVAAIAATCGLDQLAVRWAAQGRLPLGTMASTVMALRATLGAAAFALLLSVSFAVPALRAIWPLVAIFGLSLFTGALSLAWVPQAVQRTHVLGIANLGGQSVYLGLVLLGLRAGQGAWIAPAAFVAGEAAAAAGLWAWLRATRGGLARPLRAAPARAVLAEALPIGGAQLLRAASQGADLIVAGLLLPIAAVGWYGGAHKLSLLGVTTIALYIVVMLPRFAAAALRPGALQRELRASALRLALLALPVAAAVIVFAAPLLGTLFEPSFAAGARALQLLVVSLLVYAFNAHLRNALLALGRQAQDLRLVLAAAVVHLASKVGLTIGWGIEGLATGAICGELAYAVLALRVLRRALREPQ